MRVCKRDRRGDRRSLRSSCATAGSSGPRTACAPQLARPHEQNRMLREEAGGTASRRAERDGRSRFAARAAKDAQGEEPASRRQSPARGFADAGGGSGRSANGSEAGDAPPATNSTRSRQCGADRGRSGADRLPDEASWAGLRPAADLAVAARAQDAQVARPEAGAPLPRNAPHVGKRQDGRDGKQR